MALGAISLYRRYEVARVDERRGQDPSVQSGAGMAAVLLCLLLLLSLTAHSFTETHKQRPALRLVLFTHCVSVRFKPPLALPCLLPKQAVKEDSAEITPAYACKY